MGNRAVIQIGARGPSTIGIYLHWNGGPESVLAFLDAAKECNIRDPLDDNYGTARLAQLIGNFFGGSTSIGIDTIDNLDCDNGDNGVYVLGHNFTIAERSGRYSSEDVRSARGLTPEDRERYAAIKAECIAKFPLESA